MAESSLRSQRRNTFSNFCILRSCSHVAWFIVPHFLKGTENRTTRVLPNPDNSRAYDKYCICPCRNRTIMIQISLFKGPHRHARHETIRTQPDIPGSADLRWPKPAAPWPEMPGTRANGRRHFGKTKRK